MVIKEASLYAFFMALNFNSLIFMSGFSKILLIILFIFALFAGAAYYFKSKLFGSHTEFRDDVMVQKITSMGKLELVKYSMKDVIEQKEVRSILPDKRILFVAVGEVTGCIDLTKVNKTDIIPVGQDSITVVLPQPEICYVKLDHQKSKVYDVSGVWFPSDSEAMVEGIYKIAEQRLLKSAGEMQILPKTKQNALTIFKPLLENISGKKVGVIFK